jgi:hypothetical protein
MPTRLLNALRDELVTAGIVRVPSVAGATPPMWLVPKLGTPAPGEGDNPTEVGPDAVIGAYRTNGIPPAAYESFMRQPFVELRIRTRLGYLAEDLEAAITARIIDRRNFDLGGSLRVIECEQIVPLQLLGSDEQGFEHICSFSFELYAA